MNEKFFVTGAAGCIGAWVVRNLVQAKDPLVLFDRSDKLQRLELILTPAELNSLQQIQGDIADFDTVERAIRENSITHIVHLAAMQLPFCKADPVSGAKANVVGTVNIFEAAVKNQIKNLSYASSTAVYGLNEEYPEGKLAHDAMLLPRSHYGVYKVANEGSAKVYWADNQLPSIGLRPYVVYGPGRDQGMTSTPTKAILAAIIGQPYHISYGGRYCFQYAADVAGIFIDAARKVTTGAEVYNIGGPSVSTQEVIEVIEKVIPTSRGKITFSDNPLPFPEEVDNIELGKILGQLPSTSLEDGIAESTELFRRALANGKLTEDGIKKSLS